MRRLCALLLSISSAALAQEPSFSAPGTLMSANGAAPRVGAGRVDARVYAPNMLFPLEGLGYANSQIYSPGGYMGPSGGQCDAQNYRYPWFDNYCEARSWDMPLCPSGTGHQGQDIRPQTCVKKVHAVVAVEAGTITSVGSYSVYLTAADGTRYDYLHMDPETLLVREGQRVERGARLGYVSDAFGTSSTTIHLHFNLRQNIAGVGTVFAPVYTSLVDAYRRHTSTTSEPVHRAAYVVQDFPLASRPFDLAPGEERRGYLEMRNTGDSTWRPGEVFLATTEPREGASQLAHEGWLSPSRPATVDREVAPGETGRFTFSVRAPLSAGEFRQYFNLRTDSEFFSDRGQPADDVLQLRVTVVPVSCPTGENWMCDGTARVRCVGGEVERDACEFGCDSGICLMTSVDLDGDGSSSAEDCNDFLATTHPRAVEVCGDGIDQNCDGKDLFCPARLPDGSIDEPADNGGASVRASGCSGCSTQSRGAEAWLLLVALTFVRRKR